MTNQKQRRMGSFSIRRKPLVQLYRTLATARNVTDPRSLHVDASDLSTFVNGDMLDPYFRKPGSQLEQNIKLSNTLYAQNQIYANILNYYANMYYWRYKIVPRKIKDKEEIAGKTDYATEYKAMLDFAEGLSLETTMPDILLSLFKNGRVYLCFAGNSSSKTITTLKLPNNYCKPGLQTQFGTYEVVFDNYFFDSLRLDKEQIETFLECFPKEFKDNYHEYKKDNKKRYVVLNGRTTTCISMNETGFPSFLNSFYDIIDYKTYKINELNSNTNKLERIVTQEIDPEKSGITMDELEQLHNSVANNIENDNDGTKLVTTIGKIDVKQLQQTNNVQDQALQRAYAGIFASAGVNSNLFTGTTSESIQISTERDAAMVWQYIEQIVNALNLAINNIHNFGNYQLGLTILPITHYNEKNKISQYNENATLGVGIIDFIISTGTKQVELDSTMKLEEFLGLPKKLLPLQSSHTTASTGSTEETSKTDESEGNDDNKETEDSKTGEENNE